MSTDEIDLWGLLGAPVAGYCCQDAYAAVHRGEAPLHTSGCPNRCSRVVAVPDAAARGVVAGYPCGWTVGHAGDCWLHPCYRLPEGSEAVA